MSTTFWSPNVSKSASPIYQAVADALERDIARGLLTDGAKLPTHRELAQNLGVNTLTVTRAYQEAARRGLIDSTVGRGTFVRAAGSRSARATPAENSVIDLTKNFLAGGDQLSLDSRVTLRLTELLRSPIYQPSEGMARHRSAAASWISRFSAPAAAERIMITSGAQHALLTTLTAICSIGSRVMTERVTYPGIRAIAELLHLEIVGVDIDEEGISPRSFEKVCKSSEARVLYTSPNFQNPTGSVLPAERRREIAAIARKHDVLIVEDDVYGFLASKAQPTIASILPDQTCYISSTAKSISPSLRVGFISAPEAILGRLSASMAATMYFTSTIGAEVFATLVESGAADAAVQNRRSLISKYRDTTDRYFGFALGHHQSPHIWLQLPDRLDQNDFVDRARNRGVAVAPATRFAIDRENAPNAVRISIGAAENLRTLETAVKTLADLLEPSRVSSPPVV